MMKKKREKESGRLVYREEEKKRIDPRLICQEARTAGQIFIYGGR
jgi:hypothetical protein